MVRGLANIRAIVEGYPGGIEHGAIQLRTTDIVGAEDRLVLAAAMTPRWIRVEGTGEMYTLTYVADYPDGSRWHVVMVARVAANRIRHARTYFAPAMEPPAWRREHVEVVTPPSE